MSLPLSRLQNPMQPLAFRAERYQRLLATAGINGLTIAAQQLVITYQISFSQFRNLSLNMPAVRPVRYHFHGGDFQFGVQDPLVANSQNISAYMNYFETQHHNILYATIQGHQPGSDMHNTLITPVINWIGYALEELGIMQQLFIHSQPPLYYH